MTKTCQQCGKQYGPEGKSHSNFKRSLYCGMDCYNVSKRHTPEKSLAIMWSKINKDGPGGCWIWTGDTNNMGYGAMSYAGRPMVAVHRFLYQLLVRPVKPEEWCLHRCDVPRCVNPAHIFIGDAKANGADMKNKGRQMYGERGCTAILTEAAVLEIRRTYMRINGNTSNSAELAQKYGCSVAAIRSVVAGRTWKHLPLSSTNTRPK